LTNPPPPSVYRGYTANINGLKKIKKKKFPSYIFIDLSGGYWIKIQVLQSEVNKEGLDDFGGL